MTPTQLKALIGLWRRLLTDVDSYAEDVSLEVTSTIGGMFGRVRAENCLRQLKEQNMVKEGQWPDSYRLSRAGENFCETLEKLGLRRIF